MDFLFVLAVETRPFYLESNMVFGKKTVVSLRWRRIKHYETKGSHHREMLSRDGKAEMR